MQRLRGVVVRWGLQGFGFIKCADLPVEAYFNKYFVRDATYLPREGDEVTFDPVALPDGKYQARRVEPGFPREAPPVPSSAPTSARLGADSMAALDRVQAAVASPKAPASSAPAVPKTLTERLGLARKALDDEMSRREAQKSKLDVAAREAQRRVAELREGLAEAEVQAAEAERAAQDAAENANAILERAESDEIEAAAEWIRAQAQRVSETLSKRRSEARFLAEARARAVERVGGEQVQRLEDIKQRIRTAPDDLTREAFRALEATLRSKLDELGQALDSIEKRAPEQVAVLAFASKESLTVVFCLRWDDTAPDPEWRVLSACWQAAEQAMRDLDPDSEVEHGTVAGCPAVRSWARGLDPAFAEMAVTLSIDEAWNARPSLDGWKLLPVVELAQAPPPTFTADAPAAEDAFDAAPPANGGSLLDVAASLRKPLREVAVTVSALGLPHADDAITSDAEETLRRVLGIAGPSPSRSAMEASGVPSNGVAAPSRARQIASKLLGKLFRDRRIGGRHTAIENAWGKSFADSEKVVARELAERLVHRGWLREKANNGQRHISIEPEHLREVTKLIEMTSDDPALFRGLE